MVTKASQARDLAVSLSACAVLLAATVAGCEAGDPAGTTGLRAATASSTPLALAPRSEWRKLNPDGPWLVSPRFTAGGEMLLISGLKGTGLYVSDVAGELHLLDPTYRGPASIQPDGHSLCLPNRAETGEVERALPLGLQLAPANSCYPARYDPELGDILHEGPAGRWIHHAMNGELWLETPRGEKVLVEHRGPWSIRVSPDGRRVAYSLGTLPGSRLYLWDDEHGPRELGAGVHPVFHPDGLLIFSKPSDLMPRGSLTTVAQADLHALDLESGRSWALTDTPQLSEMQPALSPDGSRLAFADWRNGGLYVVSLNRRRDR